MPTSTLDREHLGAPPSSRWTRWLRSPFPLAAAATAGVLLAAGVLVSAPWLDAGQKLVSTELLLVLCPLVALCCCLRAGWADTGRARATWLLFAGACAAWTVANALHFDLTTEAPDEPFPAGGAVHLVALSLAVAGLLVCPTNHRTRRRDRLRVVLAILLIDSSVLFVSHQLVLSEVFAGLGPSWGDAAVRARLLGDVLLAGMAIVFIGRSNGPWHRRLWLLASGLLAYGVGSAAHALLVARDHPAHGTPWDLVWVGSYLLIALAGLAPVHRRPPAGFQDSAGINPLGAALVHLSMVAAIAVAAWTTIDRPIEVALGLPVLVFFGLRQTVLAADNRSMRRHLEARVGARVAELSRVLQRHQRILDAVGEGIYGVDSHGLVSFVNPAAEEQLGRPATELIGQDAHATFHTTEVESCDGGCHLRATLTDGAVVRRSDVAYRRHDGTTFPVDVTAAPKRDATGGRGAVVIFSDISERRALERMKEEFVSVVSHELRTPLTAIRGSLGLLAGGAVGVLPTAADRMVRIALDSCTRLTRLINDLLDLERIESGALPMEFQPTSCADLVTTTVTQLQTVAEAADVRLIIGRTGGQVHADPDRIVQALTNLVGNALKFSAPGAAVTVSTEQGGGQVTFRVSDTGRGIPDDMLESVFTRFQQVDSSDSRQKGGTGLGLSISRTIVERHGGRIWVESQLGEGSVFQFTLPAVTEAEGMDGQTRHHPVEPGRIPTVLLCDDDPMMLETIGGSLGRLGYRATAVASGEDVVAAATASRPDVILLDLLRQSAWQTVQELKSRPETRDIPIVVMSGLGPVPDSDLTAGWLAKPVRPEEASEVLGTVLRLEHTRPLVLVVEDDRDLADILVMLFERHGLRAHSASTQREAVTLAREVPPDVLVLDLNLPQGTGYGVIDELRQDGRLHAVPVIIYSASEVDAASRARLRLGETAFLTKTRDSPEELAVKVVQVVVSMAKDHVLEPAVAAAQL